MCSKWFQSLLSLLVHSLEGWGQRDYRKEETTKPLMFHVFIFHFVENNSSGDQAILLKLKLHKLVCKVMQLKWLQKESLHF